MSDQAGDNTPDVLAVRRGRSPNCSATGALVGTALVTAVAAGALVNTFAHRYAAWRDRAPDPSPDDEDDDSPPPGPSSPGGPPAADPPKLRREADGAWMSWPSPPALLRLSPTAATAALAAGAVPWGTAHARTPAPLEVHLAVTDRCPVACTACYLGAGPDGADGALDEALQALDELAELGVFEVALGGGEVLLSDQTLHLLRHARRRGLVPNLTTSGFGLTPARAAELAGLVGQVNVSWDGPQAEAVRGYRAGGVAQRAIRLLVDAGLRVGVNTVLTRHTVPTLAAFGAQLAGLGVAEWQWLRLKPAGRGAEAFHRLRPAPDDLATLWPTLLATEQATGLDLRIDCALVPFLVAHQPPPEALQALAVEGCSAGHSLWSRQADGRYTPCSFAHGAAYGTGWTGPAAEGWATDPTLQAWRDRAANPPAPCNTCTYQSICRGGCRIVAEHLTGDPLAADPACPRVQALA